MSACNTLFKRQIHDLWQTVHTIVLQRGLLCAYNTISDYTTYTRACTFVRFVKCTKCQMMFISGFEMNLFILKKWGMWWRLVLLSNNKLCITYTLLSFQYSWAGASFCMTLLYVGIFIAIWHVVTTNSVWNTLYVSVIFLKMSKSCKTKWLLNGLLWYISQTIVPFTVYYDVCCPQALGYNSNMPEGIVIYELVNIEPM